MKPLLSVRLTVDHIDRHTPIYTHIKLYREDTGLVWRLDGPHGDVCETLPAPSTRAGAQADVRAVYPAHSPFQPRARWLD